MSLPFNNSTKLCPSTCCSFSKGSPHKSNNVGYISVPTTTEPHLPRLNVFSETLTIRGTRNPPSQSQPLPSLRGELHVGEPSAEDNPPLSE